MPKHFLHVMDPTADAPAGDGDTESWFRFYKWKVEGEVFFPRRAPFLEISPGDFLWFGFVRRSVLPSEPTKVFVEGAVQVLRSEQERVVQEIWYRGDDLYELVPPLNSALYPDVRESGPLLPEGVGDSWLAMTKRSGP